MASESAIPLFSRLSDFAAALDDRIMRDNLRTTTWILLGATIQSVILLVTFPFMATTYRNLLLTVLPAVAFLFLRTVDALSMAFGFKRNEYLRGAKLGKWTAQYPDGGTTSQAAARPVVAFLLGFSVNHPLGVLAPGFRATNDFAQTMFADLETNKGSNGFLGQTYWTEASRDSNNTILSLSYWSSVAELHEFARGGSHRAGWNWWNATVKKHPHLGIMHEVYEAPQGGWENMYANFHPTAFGATRHLVKSLADDNDSERSFVDPLIDARKGKWRSSAGRLGRDVTGAEIDEFGNPYLT